MKPHIGKPKRSLSALARVGVMGVALVVMTSGCSLGGDDAENRDGKGIVIAGAQEPISLDPCDTITTSVNAAVLRGNVLEGLTSLNPSTGKASPLLAESWTQDNPTTWTFKLRSGVTFHDGSDFNASSAAASIKRVFEKTLACGNASQFVGETVEATAVDAQTLKVVTSVPDPILPVRAAAVEMTPADTSTSTKVKKPIGTGPYEFTKSVPAQEIELTRFDDYWGDEPEVASVRYVWRSDATVRASMVKTGEADITLDVPPQETGSSDNVKQYTRNEILLVRVDPKSAPLDDIRVRQAIAYATDKKSITASLMKGIGEPADQIVSKLVNGFIPNYQGVPFDLEKAKQLVAEAKADGVPVDTRINVYNRTDLFPGESEVAQALVQQFNASGLNFKLVSLDPAAWLKQSNGPFPAERKPSLLIAAHDNFSGDASFSFPKYFSKDGRNSLLNEPEINRMLAEAFEAAGDERAQKYQAVAEKIYSDIHYVNPIAELQGILLHSDRVDYEVNGLTALELHVADVDIVD